MKKTLLVLFTACLAGILPGQITGTKGVGNDFSIPGKPELLTGYLAATEKTDSVVTEIWSGTSWTLASRSRYSYQVSGNTTTVTVQTKSAIPGSQWVNSTKTETTVNTGGKTTLYLSSTWNTNQWLPQTKMEFAYDGTGKITLEATYFWNPGTLAWTGISKTEFSYSGADLSYDISSTWDIIANNWANSSKSEYTYSGGNLVKEEVSKWDKTLTVPDWVKTEKNEFTYNGSNKLLTETSSVWELTPSPGWVNNYKTVNTYDSNGNITLSMGYDWNLDLTPDDWSEQDKTESAWDINNRSTMFAMYTWDKNIPGWKGLNKTETTYTTSTVNYSTTVSYSWVTPTWVNAGRSTTYFSSGTTGLNEGRSESTILVYPNPATDYLIFNIKDIPGYAEVELFDINGTKILSRSIGDGTRLDISSVKGGMYVYRISGNGLNYSGRILIR